jgi:NAD-dependent dihydropyrimidine dehydrogenase PreA subunit
MPERGMGAAVGQVPEYVEQVTRWCKTYCSLPVIVKLTPNITDIRVAARAAHRGGADAVSLINTINSITSVDLERMVAHPMVGSQSTHGGYCGSAVKPIALNMVAEIARDPQTRGLPICGIGGIGNWRDAAEFMALGCGAVQVCTAAMLHGFRIVEEMKDGLSRWMDSQGYASIAEFSGRAVGNTTDWKYLDINYQVIAKIDQDACIGCGRCHIACEDTSHQAMASLKQADGTHKYEVIDDECVGCNLCQITCPVQDCIEMVPVDTGKPFLDWNHDPRNPYHVVLILRSPRSLRQLLHRSCRSCRRLRPPDLGLQPDPAQNHTGHRLYRPFELHVRQRLMVVEDVHLVIEVGVVLGRGPDHVQQARRLHRQDAFVVHPLADFRFFHLGPVVQARIQRLTQGRRAVDDFVGPDFRTIRTAAGVVHLGADVTAEHHARVVEHLEAQRVLLPDLQQVEQHRAVQLGLGAEVVMQVGARQLHFGGDVGHGGAAEAFLGEDLLRRQQDFLDVTATNLDLVIAHEGSLTTALNKTSIRSTSGDRENQTSYNRPRRG